MSGAMAAMRIGEEVDRAAQYRAARTGAILAARPDLTALLAHGKDALDLLHRLSTNDLKSLQEGQGRATVFTSNKGRILDWVTVHRLPEGILLLCGPGRGAPLREWIETYTFREQVTVEEWSDGRAVLGLYGPAAGRIAGALWGESAAALSLHAAMRVTCGGAAAILCRTFPLGGDGYLLITSDPGAFEGALLGLAADRPVPAGEECLEILRIEAGLPAHGRELTPDHNPWEARLQDSISLSKGCYVGQEVIARLNTYDKVARLLVRIRARGADGDAAAASDMASVVVPGAEVRVGSETCGAVTSSAAIPDEPGTVMALAYVRHEHAVDGQDVVIARGARSAPGVILGAAR